MRRFRIGAIVDSFRLPVREGVAKAKEIGAEGLQVYAVSGPMAPENMDAAARRDFKAYCEHLGLEIAALCGDLGGHGFERAEEGPLKIERSKRIVDLAVDLGTAVVTTHIGVIREDFSSEPVRNMLAVCRELGEYAKPRGVTFAIETGPEPAERLKRFLIEVDSDGVGVNFDPANLVMVVRDDPAAAARTLTPWIVHTHAKDGVNLAPCDPVEVYDAFAEGGGFDFGRYFNEVPLGEGAVDWDAYLQALRDAGYEGFLTIEREVGQNPEADIRNAVQFLRGKIG